MHLSLYVEPHVPSSNKCKSFGYDREMACPFIFANNANSVRIDWKCQWTPLLKSGIRLPDHSNMHVWSKLGLGFVILKESDPLPQPQCCLASFIKDYLVFTSILAINLDQLQYIYWRSFPTSWCCYFHFTVLLYCKLYYHRRYQQHNLMFTAVLLQNYKKIQKVLWVWTLLKTVH